MLNEFIQHHLFFAGFIFGAGLVIISQIILAEIFTEEEDIDLDF